MAKGFRLCAQNIYITPSKLLAFMQFVNRKYDARIPVDDQNTFQLGITISSG